MLEAYRTRCADVQAPLSPAQSACLGMLRALGANSLAVIPSKASHVFEDASCLRCLHKSSNVLHEGAPSHFYRIFVTTIMMKNILIAVVVVGAGVIVWFAFQKPAEANVWVSIDPVQCQGNPWDSEVVPEGSEGDEKIEITQFYMKQGIEVLAVESEQIHEIVCMACSCPRGDRIYLHVSETDAEQLIAQGFVESASPR